MGAAGIAPRSGDVWLRLAPILSARTAYTGAVRGGAAKPTVTPIPQSFRILFRLLLDATADPSGIGARVAASAGGIPIAGHDLPAITTDRKEFATTRVMVADQQVETARDR